MQPPVPSSSERASPSTWLLRGLLFVAAVFLLEHARPLLLPVAIAITFTFVLSAPVRALRRIGVHEYAGAAIVIVAVLSVVVALGMLIAAPAAAWWARAPVVVHELIEAVQRWRDALFPYAPPASLVRPSQAAAVADPLNERLASEGWTFTRIAIGETISFALSASATVILLYFLLASERWLVLRAAAAIPRSRTRALVLSGFRQAERDIGTEAQMVEQIRDPRHHPQAAPPAAALQQILPRPYRPPRGGRRPGQRLQQRRGGGAILQQRQDLTGRDGEAEAGRGDGGEAVQFEHATTLTKRGSAAGIAATGTVDHALARGRTDHRSALPWPSPTVSAIGRAIRATSLPNCASR